ncbi:MAG: DUF2207 domain-containing protein [Solirubrobacteraceae bacterium]|nr:DUF2207 domain-containing protein [Patulibacter sp.]
MTKGIAGRGATSIGFAVALAAILFVVLGPWTRGPGASTDKKFDVGAAAVDLDVQPDGAIDVAEHLHFRYSGDAFTGAYRDIALNPRTTLTDVSVSDGPLGRYRPGGDTTIGSDDTAGLFGTTPIDGGERVVWHYDGQDGGSRDFTLRYRALGSTDAYDDVVLVHWAIWGDQWEFTVPQLSAALTLSHPAAGDGRPERVWLQPGHVDTSPITTATGVGVSAKRIPAGTQVLLSAIYPRSAFASVDRAARHAGDGRAFLERRADAAAPGLLDRVGAWLWVHALLATLVAAALLAVLFALVLWVARERPASAPKYLPGPPSDAIPAVGHGFATEGVYSDRVVLATLLDLADRGYYTQAAGEGTRKLKQLDLVLGVAEDRPTEPALTAAEQRVLNFFDALIGEEPRALSRLKERIPKHSEAWRGKWEAMNRALEQAGRAPLAWEADLRWARWGLVGAAIVLFGAIGIAGMERASEGYIPLIGFMLAIGVLLAPRSQAFERLASKSREASAEWQAFSRWTHDFPRLSDDPPATLALWKRILVFGVAFGTAQRVIESGRIPAAILASPEFMAGTGGYAFVGNDDYGSSFGSGFASQVAAQSSSGAGGGGGGGSGGGGGGAW